MRAAEKVALISRIGHELQSRFDNEEIENYLAAFKIPLSINQIYLRLGRGLAYDATRAL
jgi:hypothetical protein